MLPTRFVLPHVLPPVPPPLLALHTVIAGAAGRARVRTLVLCRDGRANRDGQCEVLDLLIEHRTGLVIDGLHPGS